MDKRRIGIGTGLAVAVLVGLGVYVPAQAAQVRPRPDKPARLESVPGKDALARPAPADQTKTVRTTPAVRWPAAGAAALTSTGALAWAPSLPVGVRASGPVWVQLLDRNAVRPAGFDVVIRVGRTDGGPAQPATVTLSYTQFRDAYGGAWARRLQLAELPECALSTPREPGCRARPLRTLNDTAKGTLSAEVAVGSLASGPRGAIEATSSGTLVTLTSGPSSDDGDYKATDLKPSGTWSAGGVSGDFGWGYDLRMPPAVGGPAPSVQFGYSAQAVDGQTAASNSQPSMLGEGFGWHPGSIDRGYRACADDGKPGIGDMCWVGDNAILTLNGRSSMLVYDSGSGLWRPMNEDGSRVEKLANPALNNGDDDGEHWKVTTTDGTQYFFGLNRLPGWRSGVDPETASVSYLPVFGNNAGEPCNQSTFAASSCRQAYRWSLDYVVDPSGNTMSYFYTREMNHYARNATNTDTPDYVRASSVKEIDYGTRQDGGVDSVFAGTAPARVFFQMRPRCVTFEPTCDVRANPGSFVDVPWDQNCDGGSCQGHYSPTFWTTLRLGEVTTQVASGAKTWRDVERWTLTHEFKDPGDTQTKILWLKQIDHCGLVGGSACLPPVTFNATQLSNRVDKAGATSSIIRYRMRDIVTESGGVTTVSYSAPECVAGSNMPAAPDSNTKRCFPLYWLPPGATTPKLEYFHKYVVTSVAQGDLTGGAPDEVSYYDYLTAPAWHHDDNPLNLPERRSWGQWRGYQKVRETHGPAGTQQSRTEYTYFQGMNNDLLASGGRRSASVPDSDGGTWTDHDWLAGQLREEVTYLGTTTTVVDKTRKDPYQFGPTASQNLLGVTLEARVVSTAVTIAKTALDAGRGWRTTRTTNTFLADRTGRVSQVDNEGDVTMAADDQCTRYTYATNPGATMLSFVARIETVGVSCATTPDRSVDVLSDVRTWYDGATSFGTSVSRGLTTRTEQLADWNGGSPIYRTTARSTYDAHGRAIEAFDALGRRTTTVYTPLTGGPVTRVKVTNPLEWDTTTDVDPAWGAAVGATDANGRRTELAYDPFGRLTGGWLPGRDRSMLPDLAYSYTVRRTGGPSVVAAMKLNAAGTGQLTSYTLYDGQLRQRQQQSVAVGGGRLITETLYDARGLVQKTRPVYFNSAAPSTSLFVPTGDIAVPSQTVSTYDGADRIAAEALQVDGAEISRTTTVYAGDHTRVSVPTGGTATANWTDARGQVVKVWQYRGNVAGGSYDETLRTYTDAGDLATVRDPAGNTWRYFYDQRRRKLRDEDPDKGVTTYTYDDGGRLATMKDARNVTLAFVYDNLDRKTEVHQDSTAGPLLTRWTFDTQALGQLSASTRFDGGGNAYATGFTGYTQRYQPTGTKVTIPSTEGLLAGEYTTAVTYNVDGTVATRTMPARTGTSDFGILPAETLTYGYNELGMPTTLSGLSSYVTSTEYRQDGVLSSVNATDGNGKNMLQYWSFEHGTGRLHQHQVLGDFAEVVAADKTYSYDAADNVTAIADKLAQYAAGPDDTQCFRYDHVRRLTTAWTPGSGDCATNPSVGGLGGPAPYMRTYTYDAAGNRRTETEYTTGGNVDKTLTYPAAGSTAVRPHTVASVTTTAPWGTKTDNYTYDTVGNTTKRPGGTADQTLTWDPEGHLASVTDNGSTTSYVYDADGNRLMQRDPGGRSLFLAGAEFRAPASGAVVSSGRFYAHGPAGFVASRDPVAGLNWQATDHQETSQLSFRASDMSVTRRRTAPFGAVRGPNPSWPHPYGFVGGHQDGTGTVHLGARDYDPALGRFVSADPVMDVSDPQSYQGYAYADHTPVTATDADGLRMCVDACGSEADKVVEQHRRQVDRQFEADREANRKACPRNIPREDCTGDYTPPVLRRIVKNHKEFRNGTTLTIYTNGDVEISGYVLPPGHPDPYLLAVRVDERLPRVGRGEYPRPTGLAKTILAVLHSCSPTTCTDNFIRAVEDDYKAAYHNKALPSYLRAGRLQPPGMKMPEPPGPPGVVETAVRFGWVMTKAIWLPVLEGGVEALHAYCELGYQKHMAVDAGLHVTAESVAESFGKTLRMLSGVSLGVTIGCAIGESFGGH